MVVVKESTDLESLKSSYNILKEVYKRAKIPLADIDLFNNALNVLGEKKMIRFLGAYYNEKIIGVMILFAYKGVIYDWYAGSYSEYYKKYPNDLLPWKVFLQFKGDGFTMFDFGGAGKPNVPYGVRDYKKKFGGEFVNLGRYEIIHKKFLFSIIKQAFKL